MPGNVVVVQGGRLIDGTGRPPIEDAVVVIEGDRFKAIGPRGAVAVPSDAQIIDASGKTVLPGFIDGHGHWEDFHGELYLHLGITTCASIESFQDGVWTLAQKQGTDLGRIRGPRLWVSGRAIGSGATKLEEGYGGSRVVRGHITVKTADEARAAVRLKKERGCDIIKLNEFISYDIAKALIDEAHRVGMPVTAHSWDAIETAKAGVDGIEHIWSVGYTSILDVTRRHELARQRLAGNIEQEIAGSFYEPENYDDVIEAMVSRGVAWTPTIAKWLRPLSSYASRFRERENQILDNPNANLPAAVRAVTDSAYAKLGNRYTPDQRDRAKMSLEKASEFIRRFVRAGGLLKEGSDPPTGMAGLLLHEGLAMDVEAGVPPMTAIQAATLNVARAFKKDKDYGSVEVGKVADLSIIEGDPLQDIWMTQNVKMVVMGGKLIDVGFQNYKNPIPSFYSYQSLPRDLEISPLRVTEGSGPTVLTVKSPGMWPFHRVMLNGEPLPTQFISRNELQATIDPARVTEAGTYIVTVKDESDSLPESNRAHLVVTFARSEATLN